MSTSSDWTVATVFAIVMGGFVLCFMLKCMRDCYVSPSDRSTINACIIAGGGPNKCCKELIDTTNWSKDACDKEFPPQPEKE